MKASLLHRSVLQRDPDGIYRYESPRSATTQDAERLFDALRVAGVAPDGRLLVDMRGYEAIDSGARKVIYRRGQEIGDMRVAVVTRSFMQRATVAFLAMAARVSARCFDSEQEARRWLQR